MKIKVGILGSTGMLGQMYVHLLAAHPQFEIAFLAASPESAGMSYDKAVKGKWQHSTMPPTLPVHTMDQIETAKRNCALIFSAISSDLAVKMEPEYAKAGLVVISNASSGRLDSDIPLIIPEINPDHTAVIATQQRNRRFEKGFIVKKPNCSLQSYMLPLYPIHKAFEVKQISVTTLQAISGAGFPGVSALHIQDNIIPYIEGEEEKSELEPLKIFGKVHNNEIVPLSTLSISAHCNRVPVMDGHMACVSFKCACKPNLEDILHMWSTIPQIAYQLEENRPQPRLDRMFKDGMGVVIGRLRPCPLFDYRFTALSHNVIRGGSGGGIAIAELLVTQNYL